MQHRLIVIFTLTMIVYQPHKRNWKRFDGGK